MTSMAQPAGTGVLASMRRNRVRLRSKNNVLKSQDARPQPQGSDPNIYAASIMSPTGYFDIGDTGVGTGGSILYGMASCEPMLVTCPSAPTIIPPTI